MPRLVLAFGVAFVSVLASTEYGLRYRENRDELITSMQGFICRHAS